MKDFQLAREKILELCSEDDYASWELFGAVKPFFESHAQESFLDLIQDLVKEGRIASKIKSKTTSELELVVFDPKNFSNQLEKIHQPAPYSMYWFGLRL